MFMKIPIKTLKDWKLDFFRFYSLKYFIYLFWCKVNKTEIDTFICCFTFVNLRKIISRAREFKFVENFLESW
jgi:hypothetical protein